MNGEKKCKHKLSELRAITKYGMTGMAVLMTAHCAMLFEGYDAFVVHFLFWIFVGVIGIKLSQIFDLCWVYRLNVAYAMSVVMCIVMRRHDVFSLIGIDLHTARGVMYAIGVMIIILNIWIQRNRNSSICCQNS